MRIVWFSTGLMPEACHRMGYASQVGCSWLQSLLDAIRQADPRTEVCVLGIDSRPCDVSIGNVRHVSFGRSGRFTYERVPVDVQGRAQEVIRAFNPDVIHVHGTENFCGRMDDDVYCGKPVVVSLQGVLSECWIHMTGGLTPRDVRTVNLLNPRALIRGRTVFREQAFWRDGRVRQELDVFRRRKYFIGRTEWDRQCLECHNPSAQYFHVDETLRRPFYTAHRNRETIRPHSIYCAGAAAYPLKGAHWLFRAIAMLKDEFPDVQLRIADADRILSRPRSLGEWIHRPVYSDYLCRLVRDLGIARNVVALPSLDAESVVKELEMAELYVSASLCENSPNSLGEAMLVGTPAVHTCVGGVQSILKDGDEGRLVPPYSPHALAGAIRDAFRNPELMEACAQEARQTALRRHDSAANAQSTLAVYRAMLADCRARHEIG